MWKGSFAILKKKPKTILIHKDILEPSLPACLLNEGKITPTWTIQEQCAPTCSSPETPHSLQEFWL